MSVSFFILERSLDDMCSRWENTRSQLAALVGRLLLSMAWLAIARSSGVPRYPIMRQRSKLSLGERRTRLASGGGVSGGVHRLACARKPAMRSSVTV